MTIETIFDKWKDSPGDLTFETLSTILTIENMNSDNHSYLAINCDTGQHSQFLRCFVQMCTLPLPYLTCRFSEQCIGWTYISHTLKRPSLAVPTSVEVPACVRNFCKPPTILHTPPENRNEGSNASWAYFWVPPGAMCNPY